MFPDQVDLRLHIPDVRCRDNHGIFLREQDDILAIGSVGTHAVVSAAPHLITIALQPVAIFHLHGLGYRLRGHACRTAFDVLRCSFFHPAGREQLLAVPLPFLQSFEMMNYLLLHGNHNFYQD